MEQLKSRKFINHPNELLKVTDIPRSHKIELFARNQRDGWDSWGNELKILEEKQMREILFRGKRSNNGEWITGDDYSGAKVLAKVEIA